MEGIEDYNNETVSVMETQWMSILRASNVQVTLFSVSAIIGVCSNIYVIWLIYTSKCRNVINSYIIHRSIANFLFLATVPFIITQTVERMWPFGDALCKISIAVTHASGLACSFFLGALSISCYFATTGSYGSFARRQWFKLFTALSWLCAIIYAVPHLVLFGVMEFETPTHTEKYCTRTSQDTPTSVYLHVTNTVIVVIPMLISIFMSAGICLVGPTRMRMLEFDAETRSAKTLVVVLTLNFVVMYLPYVLSRIVHYIIPAFDGNMIIAFLIITPLPFIESALSPLLYLKYKGDLLKSQHTEVPNPEPTVALLSTDSDNVLIKNL